MADATESSIVTNSPVSLSLQLMAGCGSLKAVVLVRVQQGQFFSLPPRPTAGQRSLKPRMWVRFPRGQLRVDSEWLLPSKQEIRVRIPARSSMVERLQIS